MRGISIYTQPALGKSLIQRWTIRRRFGKTLVEIRFSFRNEEVERVYGTRIEESSNQESAQ